MKTIYGGLKSYQRTVLIARENEKDGDEDQPWEVLLTGSL